MPLIRLIRHRHASLPPSRASSSSTTLTGKNFVRQSCIGLIRIGRSSSPKTKFIHPTSSLPSICGPNSTKFFFNPANLIFCVSNSHIHFPSPLCSCLFFRNKKKEFFDQQFFWMFQKCGNEAGGEGTVCPLPKKWKEGDLIVTMRGTMREKRRRRRRRAAGGQGWLVD